MILDYRDRQFCFIVTDFWVFPESTVTIAESAVTIPEWRRMAM
jgi:hypothetical protein